MIIWRLPLLKARTKLESPLSREATFLYNNLLLVALCLTVFWGEIFPILAQAFEGVAKTLGGGYYDFFLRIFGIPLLLLMGIGPLIAWRRSSRNSLMKTLRWPIAAALIAGAVLVILGAGSSLPGLIGYTFCVFVLATIVVELYRGTKATGSVFTLVSRNRRRYGGYIVHVGDRAARDRGHRLGRLRDDEGGAARDRPVDADARLQADETRGLTHSTTVTESGTTARPRHLKVTGRQNHMTSTLLDSTTLGPHTRSASTRTGCAARTST